MRPGVRAFLIIAAAAIVVAIALAAAIVVWALTGPARAGDLPDVTSQERAACLSSVRRLCPAELARRDIPAGLACLIRNRERLSAACRKALADHGL